MSHLEIIQSGIHKGIQSIWKLSLIMIPVYIGISILQQTVVMEWLNIIFRPIMGLFGLPPEAAIVLVLGFTTGLYGVIGAAASIPLTSEQMFTVAIILCFAHNLFMETAIIRQLGVNPLIILLLRLGLGLTSGFLLNLML